MPNSFDFVTKRLDYTGDSEMFGRTNFSPIFANVLPHELKVHANIENTYILISILVNRKLAHKFKNSRIIWK